MVRSVTRTSRIRPWAVGTSTVIAISRSSAVLALRCGAPLMAARAGAATLETISPTTVAEPGVDLSGVQLARSQRVAPDAGFVHADIATVAFRNGAFDAVVCLYALIHVPVATMYWSHADWATYQRWFDELGYEVVHDEFVAEGDGGHHSPSRAPAQGRTHRTRHPDGGRTTSCLTTSVPLP